MCGRGDITKNVLMPGDPQRVLRIGEKLDHYEEKAFNREFRTITGSFKGVPVSACSTGIGGPSTAIAIEELAKLGAKVLIRIGSCGGYQPQVRVGDLVIPEGVVRANGTSKAYAPEAYPAVPDPELFMALVKAAKSLGFRCHTGVSLSVDAFYPKAKDFVKEWVERGVIACEMEAGTFLTVSRLKGLRAGVVLTVVNELAEALEPWRGVKKYSLQARRGAKSARMLGEEKAILVALHALSLLYPTQIGNTPR